MKEGVAQSADVQVSGTFNVQRFFETLALILSEREKVKITVKVTQREKKEETGTAGQRPEASQEVAEGGRQNGKTYDSIPQRKPVQVS